jgi:hypothetical protein
MMELENIEHSPTIQLEQRVWTNAMCNNYATAIGNRVKQQPRRLEEKFGKRIMPSHLRRQPSGFGDLVESD